MLSCPTSKTTEATSSRTSPSTSCSYSVCRNSVKLENEDGCSCAAAGGSRSGEASPSVGRKCEEPFGCVGAKIASRTGRWRQRAGLVCAVVVLLLVWLAVFEFKQFQERSRRAAFTPPTVTSLRPPDRSGNSTHHQGLRVVATKGHPAITSFVGPTRSDTDVPRNIPGRNSVHREPPTPEVISFEPLEGGKAPSRAHSGVGEPGVTLSPKEAKNRKRTFAVEEGTPVYQRGFSGSFPEPAEGVGSSIQGQVYPRQEGPRLEKAQQQGRPMPSFHGRHRLQEGSSSGWRHTGRVHGEGRQDTFGHSIVEDLSHLKGGSSRDAAPKRSHRRSHTRSRIFSSSTPPPLPSHPSHQFPTNSHHPGASYTPSRDAQHLYPKSHPVDDIINVEDQYSNSLGRHPNAQGHRQGHPLESQSRKMGHFPETRSHRRPSFQEELAEDIIPGDGGTSRRTYFDSVEDKVVEDRPTPSSRIDVMKIASGDVDSGDQIRKLLKMMNISYTRLLAILKQKGVTTDDLIESLDKDATLEEIQYYLEEPSFPEEYQPPRSYPIEDPSLAEESSAPQSPTLEEEAFEFDDKERRVEDLLFLDDEDGIESVPPDSFEYMESPERPHRGRKHKKGKGKNKKRNGRKGKRRNRNRHRDRYQKENPLAEPTTSSTPLPIHIIEEERKPPSPPSTSTTIPTALAEVINVSTALTSSTSTTTASFQEGPHRHIATGNPEPTSSTEEAMTTTTTMIPTSEQVETSDTDDPTIATEEIMASVVAIVVEEVVPDAKNQPEFYEPTREEVDEDDVVVSETVIEGPKEEYVFPIRGILILSGVMGAMAMFTLVVLVFYAIVKCSKRAPVNNYQVSSKNTEPLKAIQAYA